MKKHIIPFIVFINGMAIMILELTGSRILAPYVGTSIYVWTNLIGVILLSLSIGYYVGGMLADRGSSYIFLTKIFILASISIALVAILYNPLLFFLQHHIHDFRWVAGLSTFILFAPPSILLGVITPYAVKLAMKNLKLLGETVGKLYALGSFGSIVGTFITGYFLLSFLGSTLILIFISVCLLFCAVLIKILWKYLFVALFVIIISILFVLYTKEVEKKHGFFETDTQYNKVWIFNQIDKDTRKKVKVMQLNGENSSRMFFSNDALVYNYTKFYNSAEAFIPRIHTALMIGGAGYSYPKEFIKRYPNAELDVVEIDQEITKLAKEYFRLPTSPRLHTIFADARTFLNTTSNKYDVVYGDAFNSLYTVPFQLTTVEAIEKIYDSLNSPGVYILNSITSIEGTRGKFLNAEYFTLKKVFPYVSIYPVDYPSDPNTRQSVMLVAFKSTVRPVPKTADTEISTLLKTQWKKEILFRGTILTDNRAPVEQLILTSN